MNRAHRRRRTRRRTCEPLSIYDPIHFGIDENGLPVGVTLMYRNLLDGGEPGSGKSSLLNTIIAHGFDTPGYADTGHTWPIHWGPQLDVRPSAISAPGRSPPRLSPPTWRSTRPRPPKPPACPPPGG